MDDAFLDSQKSEAAGASSIESPAVVLDGEGHSIGALADAELHLLRTCVALAVM